MHARGWQADEKTHQDGKFTVLLSPSPHLDTLLREWAWIELQYPLFNYHSNYLHAGLSQDDTGISQDSQDPPQRCTPCSYLKLWTRVNSCIFSPAAKQHSHPCTRACMHFKNVHHVQCAFPTCICMFTHHTHIRSISYFATQSTKEILMFKNSSTSPKVVSVVGKHTFNGCV